MSDVLRDLSRVQAARPTCHWWRCPRLFAWFRVLMVVSLVKRPASAGLLSRIGDYLLLQHEGLGSDANRTDSAWHGRHQRRTSTVGTMTRSPPQPLFHRRSLCKPLAAKESPELQALKGMSLSARVPLPHQCKKVLHPRSFSVALPASSVATEAHRQCPRPASHRQEPSTFSRRGWKSRRGKPKLHSPNPPPLGLIAMARVSPPEISTIFVERLMK